MKPTTPLLKRSSFWTLALGIVIGGASMASIHGLPAILHGITIARADNSGNQRLTSELSGASMSTLRSLDDAYKSLAGAVEPAVVNIRVSANAKPGNMMAMGEEGGTGSGVIIRPDGYIVTNDHVVAKMDKVVVTMTDGREFPGKVIRGDGSDDIAIVKIEATNLPTLPFADSNKIQSGQIAMAVGSPFDLPNSVTIGHISGMGRNKLLADQHANQERFYPDLIQTDTAINPGNSGGALVNINGEVVGINTMIASPSGSSSGVGFAIPSNEVRLISDLLIQNGSAKRAQLGVFPQALTQVQEQQLGVTSGAYIATDVDSKTPAYKAGIQKGDVIVRIGSTPIVTYMDLRDCMYKYKAGDTVKVEVVRDGKHKELSATLGAATAPRQLMRQQQRQLPMDGDPFGGQDSPFQFQFPKAQPNHGNGGSQAPGEHHLGAGLLPLSDDVRSHFHIPAGIQGVLVATVTPGSLAESLGMEPGDVITKFNGKNATSREDLAQQVKSAAAGSQGSIVFERWPDGAHETIAKSFSFD